MGISLFGRYFSFRCKPYSFGHVQRGVSSSSTCLGGDDKILPVLIVGAGPVGLVLSVLLTKLGVNCMVLEKNKVFAKHPQAHFINNRSMEVFRKLDGLEEEIQRLQPPVELWRKFVYCTSLTGSILGSVDHIKPQDIEKIVSPTSVAHFSQYKLTQLLVNRLENLSFCICASEDLKDFQNELFRGKKILMGHECVSVDANEECVVATVCCIEDGQRVKRKFPCKYVIGADGAGSTIRKLVGVEMKGERELQKLVSIHFFSRDLGRYLIENRPGMLFFIFNTDAIGVLVAHDLNQGEFVLQVPFYPPQQDPEHFNFEVCKKLIFRLMGQEFRDTNVIDIKPWVMHAEVADKYVSGNNRIILCGDAAHRFPPAGAFGMNTGIQDAHNLAWKIVSVLNGIAPSSLLNTYEMERRPIALSNTSLSVQNFRAAMEVPAALGLDPAVANSVHEIINSSAASILPSGLQRVILDGIFSLGRSQLSEFILNENNPLGSSRLAKLRRIFEEGKSLQLQFPAEDIGFRYIHGALVPDNCGATATPEAPTGRRREYVPCADPGSRLPHMNVRVLSSTSFYKEIISTLDLTSVDKVEFLLMIAPLKQSYDLAHATFKAAEEFKVAFRTCVVWPAGSDLCGPRRSSAVALAPWENYVDVVEVKGSPDDRSWWRTCQMTEKGAILVRPDEHIAWRSQLGFVGDPIPEMRRVFSIVLGLEQC